MRAVLLTMLASMVIGMWVLLSDHVYDFQVLTRMIYFDSSCALLILATHGLSLAKTARVKQEHLAADLVTPKPSVKRTRGMRSALKQQRETPEVKTAVKAD